MATLAEVLRRALAPRDADAVDLIAAGAAGRTVTWVRVLRARVPAFEALDRGDIVVVPSAALAVVAGTDAQLGDIARALVGADPSAVLLVPTETDDTGDSRLARLGAALRDAGTTTIGVERGDPVAIERRIIAAIIDARPAPDDPTPPVIDEDMPAYRPHVDRLLGELMALPQGAAHARELLAPLLVGSRATQRTRLVTLRAVLEAPSLGEAAARLGVHRNTVAYRVARLEERAGWDLTDPDLRLALQVALRLVQDA